MTVTIKLFLSYLILLCAAIYGEYM